MNLYIKTDARGAVNGYALDFRVHEYQAALTIMKNLGNLPEPANRAETERCKPAEAEEPVEEKPAEALLKQEKNNKEAYDISFDALDVLRGYFHPSVRKAFKKADISYSNWHNMRTYKRISKKTWDKIAERFNIEYSIESGSIRVIPPEIETEETENPVPSEISADREGVFIRYKIGSDIQKQWMADCTQENAVKRITAYHKRKCNSALYNIGFKIFEVKDMTYDEYNALLNQ